MHKSLQIKIYNLKQKQILIKSLGQKISDYSGTKIIFEKAIKNIQK